MAEQRIPSCRPVIAILAALLLGAATLPGLAPPPDPAPGGQVTWNDVDRLVADQKLEAASHLVGEILERAKASGDAGEWTRALVEEVKLRTALHGYETAVRFLRTEPWPDDPLARTALDLVYAHALATYVREYSWEIARRERVASGGEVDLRLWDMEQILAEANRAFLEAWKGREAWGAEPLGRLARYLEQNTYPPRIRGTLRDAVTYLWVEFLADSSFWSPAQSNGVYRLDLERLLAAEPGPCDLADPSVHPLTKLAVLLADLEGWHAAAGRDEAALEAFLERTRRLASAFSRAADHRTIRQRLERRLEAFDTSLPWWSMGQAELATLVRGEDSPDALVRARAIALEGRDRHPRSAGGRRCAAIVASIEAPAFSMSTMAADGPGRRSIQVTHRNARRLFFRAWRHDLVRQIESSDDCNLRPAWNEAQAIMRSGRPDASWTVELPPTPDHHDHVTYVTPPLEEPGAWLIVASMRESFSPANNVMVAENFLLTDLVLVVRDLDAGLEVTARSGRTGLPVPGATVTLYRHDWRNGHTVVDRETSDGDGRVLFPSRLVVRGSFFLLGHHGNDLTLQTSGNHWFPFRPGHARSACLVYTDRSVYRPGQTISWKVVAYKSGGRDEVRYRTLRDRTVTVRLRDANGDEVARAEVTTNDFGSAWGEFTVPTGRLLGAWRLETSPGGLASLRVEEYRRPTFEVELSPPDEPLRLNRPAAFGGTARYYFGLPVASGTVRWTVTREPVFPLWWSWWRPVPRTAPEVIAAGETELGPDGSFTVRFTPEADEREAASPGVSYRYRLAVDATDEGGETRSAERVFRLGFVAVEARLEDPPGFLAAGSPARLTVLRTDLDGTPVEGPGHWRLVELVQPERTLLPADQPRVIPGARQGNACRTPGDLLRPRWDSSYRPEAVLATWKEGREVVRGDLEHGPSGRAALDLPALDPGAYRLVYTTEDPFGATFTLTRNLVTAAPRGTPLALPLVLAAERDTVEAGKTARLLVHSGLRVQEMVLETWRDGRRIGRQVLHTDQEGNRVVEIPIRPEHHGGVGFTLTLLRDHQLLRQTVRLHVPWSDRRLDVAFATFRDRLRPGTRETFTVTVKSHDGKALEAGTAELLAYMYDRSLDIFAPHTPPDPLSLHPDRSLTGAARATLGVSSPVWQKSTLPPPPSFPVFRPDRIVEISGYGIGGPGRRSGPRYLMKAMAMGPPAAAAEDGVTEEVMVANAPVVEAAGTTPSHQEPPAGLRTNFAETAFWKPHLLLGPDGSAVITFEVPDSVTEWNVWVHAITWDLRSGSAHRTTRSVKELMVRPYLPRFLREGDRATLKVVVNNAGETPLEGTLELEIVDPGTGEDLRSLFGLDDDTARSVPFSVEPGKGTNLGFPLTVPARVGTVAFRVTARAGGFSDGEQRPVPVLPGRMHLVQSRFAALRDGERRTLEFEAMAAGDDPTLITDQLVVTVDAQLFYSVLDALPYLVDYPYECTEQTLNRFLSTGIVTSLFDHYPAVARMAEKLAQRETRFEAWGREDPNRRMELVETPWLVSSRGGGQEADGLLRILDPRIARAQRVSALAALEKAQASSGGFPWFPGGRPSPHMTLYVLAGFARGLEFGVDAPRGLVIRGWRYLHRHWITELADRALSDDCCWELVTWLNFVLSSYPDDDWTGGVFTADDRERMLDFSFRHWREHSPLLKGCLALTLERAGRHEDARRVWDSVMDSARTDPDLGTYWAPEERAWLWYNDTIETHAFALRVLSELDPDDPRRDGLVQWLLLNKKLNHWKSTRATAEVLYALAWYLDHEQALSVREEVSVTAGPRSQTFVFEPDAYTGAHNQLVIPGEEVDPSTMSTIEVARRGRGLAFASATWHFSTEKLPAAGDGDLFAVERRYYRRVNDGTRWVLRPLAEGEPLAVGDQVEVHLSIRARHAAEYVHLRDPRGAGFEPESLQSRWRWDLGLAWYEEVRDSGTEFFFEHLPAGEYTLKYRVRAGMAGAFRVAPATLQSMYAPEFAAYSSGTVLEVVRPDGS